MNERLCDPVLVETGGREYSFGSVQRLGQCGGMINVKSFARRLVLCKRLDLPLSARNEKVYGCRKIENKERNAQLGVEKAVERWF